MKLETAYDCSWHPERYSGEQCALAMALLRASAKRVKTPRRAHNSAAACQRLGRYIRAVYDTQP